MTDKSREELVSAYLDDELSHGERAQVEAWLAESAELRQWHDDLLAMRGGLQSLARHQLDRELAPAVLRQAEQQVLRGARQPSDTPAEISSSPGAKQAERPGVAGPIATWWGRGAGWRRVVWPALAIAAALAVLVVDARRRPEQHEVAMAPPADAIGVAEDEAPAAATSVQPPSEHKREMRAAPEMGESASPMRAMTRDEPLADDDLLTRGAPSPGRAPRAAGTKVGRPMASFIREVPADYLQDRSFEKLLDKRKIKWQHIAATDADMQHVDEAAKSQRVNLDAGRIRANALSGVTYVVYAAPEQLQEVLALVPASPRYAAGEQDASRYFLKPPADAVEVQGVSITLVAPPARVPDVPPQAPAGAK